MKKLNNMLVHFYIAILLSSCAAALVPESSDPKTKIRQAYDLISVGRTLPAEKLIGQALAMFKKKGELDEVGRSYLAFGDLYKIGRSEGILKLPDYKKSADSYAKAAEVYKSINYSNNETMALWFAGGLYNDIGDKKLGCNFLAKALSAFRLNATDKTYLKNTESYPANIKLEQKKYNCI